MSSVDTKKVARHYTPVEKKLLVQILHNYKDIVENKKTDGATVKTKTEAWKLISEEFNSSSLITEGVCKYMCVINLKLTNV